MIRDVIAWNLKICEIFLQIKAGKQISLFDDLRFQFKDFQTKYKLKLTSDFF